VCLVLLAAQGLFGRAGSGFRSGESCGGAGGGGGSHGGRGLRDGPARLAGIASHTRGPAASPMSSSRIRRLRVIAGRRREAAERHVSLEMTEVPGCLSVYTAIAGARSRPR